MFPRERVLASLAKYKVEHHSEETTDVLKGGGNYLSNVRMS